MKKSRNTIIIIVVLLTLLTLISFKGRKHTFSSNGITVTLTSKFKSQQVSGAQVAYLTRKVGFMGNRDLKALTFCSKLEGYTKKVVAAANLKDVEIFKYNEDGVTFMYAYYLATVDNIRYKYMLVTKEGNNAYYTMNFWSLEKNFNKYEKQFMKWAKTIIVE